MDLKLTKLPWQTQLGVSVALAAIVVGLFVYFYDLPKQNDIATRQGQLAKLKVENAKGQATEKKLPEFKAEVAALDAQLTELKKNLPDEKDAAELLRGLQTVAAQSNLTIKSFKPAPTVTKPCTPSGRSRSSSTARTTTSPVFSIASASSRGSSTSAGST